MLAITKRKFVLFKSFEFVAHLLMYLMFLEVFVLFLKGVHPSPLQGVSCTPHQSMMHLPRSQRKVCTIFVFWLISQFFHRICYRNFYQPTQNSTYQSIQFLFGCIKCRASATTRTLFFAQLLFFFFNAESFAFSTLLFTFFPDFFCPFLPDWSRLPMQISYNQHDMPPELCHVRDAVGCRG